MLQRSRSPSLSPWSPILWMKLRITPPGSGPSHQYWPPIGRTTSRDLNTGLWLAVGPPAVWSQWVRSRRHHQHNLPLLWSFLSKSSKLGVFLAFLEQLGQYKTITFASVVSCWTVRVKFYKLSFSIYALIFPKYDEIYLATASESGQQQRGSLQSVLSSPGCYQHKVRNTNMDFPESVLTSNMFWN